MWFFVRFFFVFPFAFREYFSDVEGVLRLTLCLLGNCVCFLSSVVFLNKHFRKNLSGIRSECQTVLIPIQIRPDVLSGLIWVQTLCKGCQLKRAKETEKQLARTSSSCEGDMLSDLQWQFDKVPHWSSRLLHKLHDYG